METLIDEPNLLNYHVPLFTKKENKGKLFVITWYVTKEAKFREPIKRSNEIVIEHPSNDISIDGKLALNKFTRAFGGLNKNTIVSIQEYGYSEEGLSYPIGEPIVPTDSSIIPTGK